MREDWGNIGDQDIIGHKLSRLFNLLIEKDSMLYSINFRNAGWGITVFEQSRVTAIKPELEKVKTYDETRTEAQRQENLETISRNLRKVGTFNRLNMEQGLVTYTYKETLEEAIDAELERLGEPYAKDEN